MEATTTSQIKSRSDPILSPVDVVDESLRYHIPVHPMCRVPPPPRRISILSHSPSRIQPFMAIKLRIYAAVAVVLLCASSFAFAQKDGNNRRDEKRENERVRNAEQDVSQARKRISELQNELRSQWKKLDSVHDKVTKSKEELRDARDAAESELGAKLGIPNASPTSKINERSTMNCANHFRKSAQIPRVDDA